MPWQWQSNKIIEQPRLRELAQDEFEDMDDTMFGDNFHTTESLHTYWEKIQSVHIEAERCYNSHKDENAWVEVARSVFGAAGLVTSSSVLEISSM